MADKSPYAGRPPEKWKARTKRLIAAHPLDPNEIVEVVLECWESIFASRIGTRGFQIGKDILPKPQVMGFLLHELIPLELTKRHPDEWRIDQTGRDKDLVYAPDESLSVEIKTSTHASRVFGNRSYVQPAARSKKRKAGYYIAVNFQKFSTGRTRPQIVCIRFGWLDHSDWIAQKAATGQQARLAPHVYGTKLLQLFPESAKS